jgi:hypothetical protein
MTHLEKEYVGKGRLAEEDGTPISTVDYVVNVFRQMIPDGLGGTIPGTAQVRGTWRGVNPMLMRALAQSQKGIVLLMDEHQLQLPIFVTDIDTGTFTGRAGLPQPA